MIRRFLPLPIVLALFVGACGGNDGADHAAAPADTAATSAAAQSPDVAFIDQMVPHHEMAIHMADMVLMNGSSADLKALAQRMKDSQQQEVARMKATRTALAGSDETPMMSSGHDMAVPMDSMMAMTGEALDRAFLQSMIPHHRQALEMTQAAQPTLTNPDIQALAQQIITEQQQEIAEMERMQAN